MGNITVKINGEVKTLDAFTAGILADIITTQNPGASTMVEAVNKAGGEAYVTSKFTANKSLDDIFEVEVIGTSKGKKVTTTGKASRGVIAKRFMLALSANEWVTEVTRVIEGESETESTGNTPAVMADI